MPKLWTDTIEEHRAAVREAVLDAAAELVADLGLTGVTMSAIAERTGIGRATLYKYFPDVETVLGAWHERQVGSHLQRLSKVAEEHDNPGERLAAVLAAYAENVNESRRNGAPVVAAQLHRGPHMHDAEMQLREMLADLISEGRKAGAARRDVPAEELADYALAALGGAARLASSAAVKRLVAVVLDGIRPVT
jgi:AcrR family transcriptional regulator